MLKYLRVNLWILLLPGSMLLLSAQATSKLVDDLWFDFLRLTKKPDPQAIRFYFERLESRNPTLPNTDMGYAITLVSKWSETADLEPEEKASIALLCGKFWPKGEFQQYMPAFFYESAYEISKQNKLYDLSAEALAGIINLTSLTDKALPFVMALEKMLDAPKIQPKLTQLDQKYHALAQYYYRLRKHDLAILYNKKVLEFPESHFPVERKLNRMNTIALSYKELGQYDEAIRCYDEVIGSSIEAGNKDWEYIAKGNKGMVMLELGRLEEAEALLEEDFQGSLLTGQDLSALNASVALAKLMLKNKDLDRARKYLETAGRISDTLLTLQQTILTWSDYYVLAGDWEQAYHFRKRAHEMEDSVNQTATTREFYRTREQHSLFQQKELMNQSLLAQETARKAAQRNFIIAICILALIISGFSVIFYLKNREQQMVHRHLQERYAENKEELDRYVKRLQHHNELSLGIEEHLRSVSPNIDQETIRALLLQFTFSTETDWEQFKHLFDEVHHDFILHLQQQSINLTPGEIRLLVLLKLEFNNREIARTLGISLEGVKKSKQRLRKKIQHTVDPELSSLLKL
ncbi:MAG: tetratricopeptide repeat protein [Saprospiraceae bacterium]